MPRAKRLNTAEAAAQLGISESQMLRLAKDRWIGKKEGGRWTFTVTEIRKLGEERADHQKYLKLKKRNENAMRRLRGLPPKRKKRKKKVRHDYDDDLTPARGRRRKVTTIDDLLDRQYDPLYQLDRLLAQERAVRQLYQLPFRAPLSTRYMLVECPSCKAHALMIIDCDNGSTEADLDGYERLTADLIGKHGLPTILRLPPHPEPPDPASRMTFRLLWPDDRQRPQLHTMAEPEWDAFIDSLLGRHCA